MAKTVAREDPKQPSILQPQSQAEGYRIAIKSAVSGQLSPERREKQKQLLLEIGKRETELRGRAALLSNIGEANYDLAKEYPNFCVALYSIRTLHEIEIAAGRQGTEAGAILFATVAEQIFRSLNGGFFNLDKDGLAARFSVMHTWFDACSIEFGTRSLPFEQIMHDYTPLVKLFFEEHGKKSP
jgi:hypothetical protein